jgi:VanZ family protein
MQRRDTSSRHSTTDRRIDAALWAGFACSIAFTLFWALGAAPPGGRLFPRADKVFHAFAFASILGTFLLAGVWRPGRGSGRYEAATPAFIAGLMAFGVIIELVQSEISGRDADILDLVADLVGMGLAIVVVRALGWGRPLSRGSRGPGP